LTEANTGSSTHFRFYSRLYAYSCTC